MNTPTALGFESAHTAAMEPSAEPAVGTGAAASLATITGRSKAIVGIKKATHKGFTRVTTAELGVARSAD